MDNPQLEDGYTRIANEIIEALARSCPGGTEAQIIFTVIRRTYGWHKKEDQISVSQLVEATGKSRRMVIYALQNLEAKKFIKIRRQRGAGHINEINTISFNKNHREWVVQEKSKQYQKALKNRKLRYKNNKAGVVQEIVNIQVVQETGSGSARNGARVVQETVNNSQFLAPTKERKKELQKNPPPNPPRGAGGFNWFWKIYPKLKHDKKKKALASWNKKKPPINQVMAALEWQIPLGKCGGRSASAWINQERWKMKPSGEDQSENGDG